MIKKKRIKSNNKYFFIIFLTNMIIISVFLLFLYFYKNVSFLILMLTCLSILNSYNYLSYHKNNKEERLEVSIKLASLIKNNNYEFDKELKFDTLNKEFLTFNEATYNNIAIKPYVDLFTKIESRNIKEVILNYYVLNNKKFKKEEIINKNMILINTIHYDRKENKNSLILISYIFLLITIVLFIMKVII